MPEVYIRPKNQPKESNKRFNKNTVLFSLLIICLMAAVGWRLLKQDVMPQAAVTPGVDQSPSIDSPNTTKDPLRPKVLKTFSGEEFVELYDNFAYPNVQEFEISPYITGNKTADGRIRSLAIARGYKARSLAIPPLADVGSMQLQARSLTAWHRMVTAAAKDGIKLTMTAGFRTIEDQRTLFLDALYSLGATKTSIAAGNSDSAVISVLKRISIPGYTRHHSGYTVDIGCSNDPGKVFAASNCFAWLSSNNYDNAKTYGWIPSYPAGAPNQGPDPEAWEYSWVGYDAVHTFRD